MSLEKGKKKGSSRREILGLAAAAGVVAGTVAISRHWTPSAEKQKQQEDFEFLNVRPHPQPYPTGPLEHRKFSPKLSQMTGIVLVAPEVPKEKHGGLRPEPRVPREAQVDFSYQLALGWKKKVQLMQQKHGAIPVQERDAIKALFTEYHSKSAGKASLASYRERIGTQVEEARAETPLGNITHLRAFADLLEPQVELLRALERRMTSSTLLACSMTELMPTSGPDAGVGVEVYDWLLKNAGEGYVEDGMPALGDAEFSFGPYQFIPGALSDGSGHPEGARLIEQLAPSKRLPADLGALRGKDQHRAAYLLSVHNLALLVRNLREIRSGELLTLLPQMPADVVSEFVAAAHHNPARANNVFNDYLYKYQAAVKEPAKYQKPDFVDCCAPEGDLGPYARKTRDNLQALRAHFSGARAVSE